MDRDFWTSYLDVILTFSGDSPSQTATLNTCVSAGLLPREGALWNGYFPEFNSCLFTTSDTGETGGDVLKVERDNPVVILMIYRTRFFTLSLDSGAQHDDAFV